MSKQQKSGLIMNENYIVKQTTTAGNTIAIDPNMTTINWPPPPSVYIPTWDLAATEEKLRARCYNKQCNNETSTFTELKLGRFLNLKICVCDSCLKDLAEKVKGELGLEDDE